MPNAGPAHDPQPSPSGPPEAEALLDESDFPEEDGDPEDPPETEEPATGSMFVPWTLTMVYSVVIGLVVGTLIIKLSSGSDPLPDAAPVHTAALFTLEGFTETPEGARSGPFVRVNGLSDSANHGAALVKERLRMFGLKDTMGLVEVTVENSGDSDTVALTDRAGSLVLEMVGVQRLDSLPFPKDVPAGAATLRAVQARLEGDVPPQRRRTGLKVMPAPVDLAQVRRGTLELADGRKIALQPVAQQSGE